MNINTTLLGQTTIMGVPWWDIAAQLFGQTIGVMGRFEAWKGRWGFFLDRHFVYMGGTLSDSGGKQITLGRLPVNRTLLLSGDVK